ncbi:hypothetical protein NE237_025573 [Protea cynaroides]|uniref:Uncharacterized protein n=1 Tax=Protea cynaroides TaxID=273540 RepID=A0A9Q0H243_9MAGN|nr:hypothetical protein NE237_025573 [Protea cynaroides]
MNLQSETDVDNALNALAMNNWMRVVGYRQVSSHLALRSGSKRWMPGLDSTLQVVVPPLPICFGVCEGQSAWVESRTTSEDSVQVLEGVRSDPGWRFVMVDGRGMQPVGGWAIVDSRLNQPTRKGSHGKHNEKGKFQNSQGTRQTNGEVEVRALASGVDPNGDGNHSARVESMVTPVDVVMLRAWKLEVVEMVEVL